MNGQTLFELIQNVDEDLVLDAMPASYASLLPPKKPRRKRIGEWMSSPLIAAMLSGIVAIGILVGVVLATRQDPSPSVDATGESETSEGIIADYDPNHYLTVSVSSGQDYKISSEIFLGGTFYDNTNGSTSGSDPAELLTYDGEPLPDANALRKLAPALLENAVYTVFAEDTVHLGADSVTLQVYDAQFEPVDPPGDATTLGQLSAGTYYVVAKTHLSHGDLALPDRTGAYPIQSADLAYTFALIKQDFLASYQHREAYLTVHTSDGEKTIPSSLIHNIVLESVDKDGKIIEHRSPYRMYTPEEILALKDTFEENALILDNFEGELQVWDGLSRYTSSGATAYDKITGDSIVYASNVYSVAEYVDLSCHLLLRYAIQGGTVTMGDMTYTVKDAYYEFPIFATFPRMYTSYVPKVWLSVGDASLLLMNESPVKTYSAEYVRKQAAETLPACAARLTERTVTITPDAPLTLTLHDPETHLQEVCVYNTYFEEVAAGEDPTCINTLPNGYYYAVFAVGARGQNQRDTTKTKIYTHLYYASIRLSDTGGGIASSNSAFEMITLHTNRTSENEGHTYHLIDNLADYAFNPDRENQQFNVRKNLPTQLKTMADVWADMPVTLYRGGEYVGIDKPFNIQHLTMIEVFDTSGDNPLVASDFQNLCISDWNDWTETQLFYDLAPGRYYVVFKLLLPDSPDGTSQTAYDYPFLFAKE